MSVDSLIQLSDSALAELEKLAEQNPDGHLRIYFAGFG